MRNTIYTIVKTEQSFSEQLSVMVIGSYPTFRRAKSSLVEHIIERAQHDARFSDALWHDDNSGDELRESVIDDFVNYFCRDEDSVMFPPVVLLPLRKFLGGSIDGDGTYHVSVGIGASEYMVHYDIVENELEL